METCYICSKKTKKIVYNPFLLGEVSGVFENLIIISEGIFSKKKIFLCAKCLKNFKKLYPKDIKTGKPNDAEVLTFIENNKDKIMKGILDELPLCPGCQKRTKAGDLYGCQLCDSSLCDNCDPIEWSKLSDNAGDFIEDYIKGDVVCPKCYHKKINSKIIHLLNEKKTKISVSDIAAFLDFDREFTKWQLDRMYKNKEINFAGNGRYFILNDDKTKAKSSPKKEDSESGSMDIEKELEKFKGLLDKGLIEQSDYDTKKKELLGL